MRQSLRSAGLFEHCSNQLQLQKPLLLTEKRSN